MSTVTLTVEHARKVRDIVRVGLCSGKGKPVPGQMCVEAAVCYAFGLSHDDRPPCVEASVREFKIKLNDAKWSSKQARAKGMERIAIAQLGSFGTVNPIQFATLLSEETIRQIVPIALRTAAKENPSFAERLEAAAVKCETEGTKDSAIYAQRIAYAADAEYAEYAAEYAEYAAYATAVEYAAYATAAACERDKILSLMADIGVKVLQKCGSPGCQWLHICDE